MRASSSASTSARASVAGRAHQHGNRSAFGGIRPPLGQGHGIDRLQRRRRIEPAALRQARSGFGGAHELGDALQHDVGQVGERVAAGDRLALGRQAQPESAFVESVGGVLDLVDGAAQRLAALHARAGLARLHGETVGLLLHLFGAPRQALAFGGGCRTAADRLGDGRGKRSGDAEMAHQQRQHGELRGIEELRQLGLDLVADQAQRAAAAQPLAGLAQHAAQEFRALRGAQRGIEPRAVGNAADRGAADRLEDEIGAAQLEEGAMAEIVHRRPVEDVDRFLFADEGLQRLARLVPVDQEDQPRAQEFEEGEQGRLVGQACRPVMR